MGSEIEPLSLAGAVRYAHEATAVPFLITEHGMSTADDQQRAAFIEPSLDGLLEAMTEGVPVAGLLPLDAARQLRVGLRLRHQLGLHEVDRETFARTPKPSRRCLRCDREGTRISRMTTTRWGIAGTGGIARTTMKDLRLTENVEVVAVSSRDQARADAFAGQEGIPRAYGDYARMLEDPDVDVVYICTPHGSHFPMAAAAIEAGKHVLGEKPLGVDAGQARS